MKRYAVVLLLTQVWLTTSPHDEKKPLYFCTAADSDHYNWMLNLIGCIHKYDYNLLGEIAVFDLGFSEEQKKELSCLNKVKVYTLEMTHPDLLTHFQVRSDKKARGWYAWKPVVLKQALDMFPYVLYLDAGVGINCSSVPIFEYIHRNGYFFVTCFHSIKWMTPKFVIEKFNLEHPDRVFILDDAAYGMSAGIQGVSRKIYDAYVMPMYELSKDINNFIDDGSTPDGFGTARNDQPIFSIQARLLNFKILDRIDHLVEDLPGRNSFLFGYFFKLRFNRTEWGPELMQKYIRCNKPGLGKFIYSPNNKIRPQHSRPSK